MSVFDSSSLDIYALKANLTAVPGGADPNKYWAAIDTLKLRTFGVDTHAQIRGGKFYGLADQGADPLPGLGAGKSYIYGATAALKWKDSAALLRTLHDDKSNLSMLTAKTLTVGANILIGSITDKLNPVHMAFASQAAGDLAVADAATTFARLAKGADNTVLRVSGGALSWSGTPTLTTLTTTGAITAGGNIAASSSAGTQIKSTTTGSAQRASLAAEADSGYLSYFGQWGSAGGGATGLWSLAANSGLAELASSNAAGLAIGTLNATPLYIGRNASVASGWSIKFDLTNGSAQMNRRLQWKRGTVAAANNLSLPTDANQVEVSGNTQVNLIDSTDWQAGSEVLLHFTGTPLLKHNQAASGANKPIMLAGSIDYTVVANDRIRFYYDGTQWWQASPKVAA